MSPRTKAAEHNSLAEVVRIEPDEAAAIGTLLLFDRLESAGPIGRICYRELKQHEAATYLIDAESEDFQDPSGD